MLIGIPASGKSTWVKTYLEAAENPDDWVVVSSDNYIEKKALIDGKTYTEVFTKYAPDAERACAATVEFAVENELNIIWDQTNLRKNVRKKRLKMIPESYSKYFLYQKAPPFDELRERLDSRPGKEIPFDVLVKMIETAEPPTLDEGFHGMLQ